MKFSANSFKCQLLCHRRFHCCNNDKNPALQRWWNQRSGSTELPSCSVCSDTHLGPCLLPGAALGLSPARWTLILCCAQFCASLLSCSKLKNSAVRTAHTPRNTLPELQWVLQENNWKQTKKKINGQNVLEDFFPYTKTNSSFSWQIMQWLTLVLR